jgi:uncharacterized protein YjbI with pentapeptide repeats
MLTALATVAALYFNTHQTSEALRASRDQIEQFEQGQLTDRFSKAVEHIGASNSVEVRLGGIYALERIARDSDRDHPVVMELLSAFVREHAPLSVCTSPASSTPATDVQAALTVISRRNETRDYDRLDLARTCLRGAVLANAKLSGASLVDADLRGADLIGAKISNATLVGVDFTGALLSGADLGGANLTAANLSVTELTNARFGEAKLVATDFTGAVNAPVDHSGRFSVVHPPVLTPTDAPTLISPTDGKVFVTYPRDMTFTWKTMPGATNYFVEIECLHCTLRNAWLPWADTETAATGYSFIWAGRNHGRWRVTPIAANGTRGAASTWWYFTFNI